MARKRRPYLPGVVFHLTARTQGGAAWFGEPLRSRIVQFIREAMAMRDHRQFAFCVMPNHLHLVVQHGSARLGELMQPLLRRVALLVQRTHDVRGHVFGKPYFAGPCMNPEHLRNAIVYTHLNPVRAGLCAGPEDWPWSSHVHYRAEASTRTESAGVAAECAIGLFAPRPGCCFDELAHAYQRFERWRLERDLEAGPEPLPWWAETNVRVDGRPDTLGGDLDWGQRFSPFFQPELPRAYRRTEGDALRADMRDIASWIVRAQPIETELDAIRGRNGNGRIVQIRRTIILRLREAGYRGCDIARFLRISDSQVSRIISAARRTTS
jgi:REP element-mobilizing transposase RayT